MPRRDGSGPLGEGPMTGLGLGGCAREVRELMDDRESRLGLLLAAGGLCMGLARRFGRRGRMEDRNPGRGPGRRFAGRLGLRP